ncbi:MAG: polysaccharide biosynthesis/export family protein [Planctomycetota bacterium]
MNNSLFRTGVLTGALLMGVGCQPTYHDYAAFVREPRPAASPVEYRVAPPDAIAVTSRRVREIDGQQQRIAPDGHVYLPLVGPVFVAGKTPVEIEKEIEARAQHYYEDADVSVRITTFASKKIFVFGQVGAPGQYVFTGSNTVLNTLARAQPTRLADPSKIHVLRPNADGDLRRRMTIDLDKIVQEGDTTLDAPLEEGDILFVPPNPLAAVGLALQQLLLPIQPAAAVVAGPGNIQEELTGERSYGETTP